MTDWLLRRWLHVHRRVGLGMKQLSIRKGLVRKSVGAFKKVVDPPEFPAIKTFRIYCFPDDGSSVGDDLAAAAGAFTEGEFWEAGVDCSSAFNGCSSASRLKYCSNTPW